jgi:Tol biopolymer transport system component
MDQDGSNPHALTSGDLGTGVEWYPRWSPEGDQIAYLDSNTPGNVSQIRVMGANGENWHSLDVSTYNLAWARDNRHLYFQYGTTLKIIDAQDKSSVRSMFDWNKGYENAFDIAPDEKWMVSEFFCEDSGCPGSGQIYKLLFR